jgi:hypothetical protein
MRHPSSGYSILAPAGAAEQNGAGVRNVKPSALIRPSLQTFKNVGQDEQLWRRKEFGPNNWTSTRNDGFVPEITRPNKWTTCVL